MKTAAELMDKRAIIYSDRPIMVMAQELFVSPRPYLIPAYWNLSSVGWGRTPVLTSSEDPRYTRYRKLFHTALRKERVRELAPLQEKSSHTMLKLILDKPDDWIKHIR
jgi:cytochrome P450